MTTGCSLFAAGDLLLGDGCWTTAALLPTELSLSLLVLRQQQLLLLLCHSDASGAACAAACLAELARSSRRKRRAIAELGGIKVLLAIAERSERGWVRHVEAY